MPTPQKLELGTGSLSREELDALLNSLPIDITFVDSTDTVRYFNRLGKRIFARTPAVIGRKVQQCHPQKSIDRVNAILSDFKSGKTDSAEFWINLKGRLPLKEGEQRLEGVHRHLQASGRLQSLIHIRYFAVRDRKGKYLGCLEATQDITGIKRIEGEKRL
ncbi:MAG TPA: PAS domain-containing protein [archaeon]|nr:PAS domain-containing protein [archaeon]